jgi:cyclopropane-fatty-acyl-phospholipid synthase
MAHNLVMTGSAATPRPEARGRERVERLLEPADVRLDGGRPWDVAVADARFYTRFLREGMLGLGDSYVDGWWECGALDQFYDRILSAGVPGRLPLNRHAVAAFLGQVLFNQQSRRRARRNIESHYHLGNDVFEATLDRRMLYTCGYWKNARNVDEAQEAKLDLVCRKIGLKAGQRVLDVGCGWGSFGRFAAERYGASTVGLTISTDTAELAREACRGLPVETRVQDYREVTGEFDHVVSMGCMEHVGPRNYRTFMEVAARVLRDRGLFLLHTIGTRQTFPNRRDTELLWMQRRIFPGGALPSLKQVAAAADGLFVVEDVQNFGADYDPTLMAWWANFTQAWPKLAGKYGERFYRTWKYYLLTCAGCFRSRKYQLWQFVLSKHGVRRGWAPVTPPA